MWTPETLQWLLISAGCGQLVLAAAAPAIPVVLDLKTELRQVRPLTRELFWTYVGYIWIFIISFGLLSTTAAHHILDNSPLATAVCGFIALFWTARLVIQFVWFHAASPAGLKFRVAEVALTTLFFYLSSTYIAAFAWNLMGA